MTQEDKEDFEIIIGRFCEKELSDKVLDHCHLTDTYTEPAQSTCNLNVK